MLPLTSLDDAVAQRVLLAVVRQQISSVRDLIPYSPEIRASLAEYFGLAPAAVSVSSGDLARQALMLLQENPSTSNVIAEQCTEPLRSPVISPMEIGIGTAVLFVLRTHLEVSRDKAGKWMFKLKVKSLSDSALKPLIEKLIAYFP